jgi:hypothetical protein
VEKRVADASARLKAAVQARRARETELSDRLEEEFAEAYAFKGIPNEYACNSLLSAAGALLN